MDWRERTLNEVEVNQRKRTHSTPAETGNSESGNSESGYNSWPLEARVQCQSLTMTFAPLPIWAHNTEPQTVVGRKLGTNRSQT